LLSRQRIDHYDIPANIKELFAMLRTAKLSVALFLCVPGLAESDAG
jgi:hypothetical protein